MSTLPSSRGVRMAALGLFVVLPLGLAGFGAMNFLEMQGTQALIRQQEGLLAQLDARIARLDSATKEPLDTSGLYLDAHSRPLAAADLQQRMVKAIGYVGGKLIETQQVDPEEGDPADQVALRVTLDTNNAGLLALLYDLETDIPLMTLSQVSIRQLPAGEAAGMVDPLIRVDLVVRSYWKAAA
jgi:Type II secretion system (T2SS), protein M subtype b